ncbi:MAG TPA: hypothetical protein VGW78_00090, partial [Candidatus Babeliales bacterium]|nr:hypothetical protein [Candidatus Babeliales bacterium]
MKKLLIGIFLLFSWPMHSMFMVNNIQDNWNAYLHALRTRFGKNRIVTGSFVPYAETVADFTPAIGTVLTESGIVEKGIQAIPYGDPNTKQKWANSIKNGTRTALGIAVLNGTTPYGKKSYGPTELKDISLTERNKKCETEYTFIPYSYGNVIKEAWNKQTGLPFVSPAKNALIYTSVYVAADMSTDLLMQSETAQKAIDAIPGARTVHNAFKNNV